MAETPHAPPSFSPARRWRIGFDLLVRTLLVLAVMVMINYLGAGHFYRFYLSSQTRVQLASRTLSVLQAITNQVNVTVYYDRKADFYGTVDALLEKYHEANPLITVRTVDYVRDAGEAEKVKTQYNLGSEQDVVIFDANHRTQVVPGDALVQTVLKAVPNEKELEFEHKPVAFVGEMWFTTALLALENGQPLKAYFLQGHGEPSLSDSDPKHGYQTFGRVLHQNYLAVTNLELFGDQVVPEDCNLLIIAAPVQPLDPSELLKIDTYLNRGGRLFALLDYRSIPGISEAVQHPTGLEDLLRNRGINVGNDYVVDTNNTISGQDVKVQRFADHPVSSSLSQLSMQLILPRPVAKIVWSDPPANAPEVTELAFSGPDSTLAFEQGTPAASYPLIAAAEQKAAAGVANPHGNLRIIAAGDSYFLGNHYIEDPGNRNFVSAAVNWLLDRSELVPGVGPQNITEFHLAMSRSQQQDVRWILLGGLPGVVLALGLIIWLVRRK